MSPLQQTHNLSIRRINECAFLLDLTPPKHDIASEQIQARIWSLAHWIDQRRHELDILNVVPGIGNLLVQFDNQPSLSPAAVIAKQQASLDLLQSFWHESPTADYSGKVIKIPVIYGGDFGPDLAAVAKHCRLSASEVIARHSAGSYRVFCIGFQPGFAYLGGLEAALHCPRKTTPDTRIPAGSVAIGGSQTGIYPFASPGGWQIIGCTNLPMFDSQADPASRLKAGDEVRFTQATP